MVTSQGSQGRLGKPLPAGRAPGQLAAPVAESQGTAATTPTKQPGVAGLHQVRIATDLSRHRQVEDGVGHLATTSAARSVQGCVWHNLRGALLTTAVGRATAQLPATHGFPDPATCDVRQVPATRLDRVDTGCLPDRAVAGKNGPAGLMIPSRCVQG